jgi:hypothetical protein
VSRHLDEPTKRIDEASSHRPLSLEQALELIREDEWVEVTPSFIRLRKVEPGSAEAPDGRVPEGPRPGRRLTVT